MIEKCTDCGTILSGRDEDMESYYGTCESCGCHAIIGHLQTKIENLRKCLSDLLEAVK